jgi:hypothetical protein
MYVNILTFSTYIQFGSEEYYNYDLREPKRKIIHPDKIKETKKSVVTTNDWTNIPYYPTDREKRENVAKYLVSMNKPVPATLLQQIKQDKQNDIQEDSYNKNILINTVNTVNTVNTFSTVNKYSPQYANYIGVRPRSQISARIGMGGSY